MNCSLCNIHCPSSYQYEEHLRGRKHAERLRGKTQSKGQGVCFYWENSTCYKGDNCTFLHTTRETKSTFSSGKKRDSSYCKHTSNPITPYQAPEPADDEFEADILLCKSVKKVHEIDPETGLAPIFQKKPSPKRKKESRFPEVYRNAFHRKRNVNLYIQKDLGVVFEFAYDTTIIQAIKTQIKGRAWNPGMKCWTCPLESLPDAIALYAFMGRQVDESLHERAKELTESLGSSSSDSIQMSFQLSSEANSATIGQILVKFLYDADIVAALKKLSPLQRSYEPSSRIWTVDLLALPELLEHLHGLDYNPSDKLQEVAKSCETVQQLLGDMLPQEEKDNTLDNGKGDAQTELEAAVKELVRQVNQAKGNATKVNRSNCGEAKRRKLLTKAQRKWARKKSGDWDSEFEDYFSDDDSEVEDDDYGFDVGRWSRTSLRRTAEPPVDCDCGQPYLQVGRRHVCRYFGTFDCGGCGNRWTSAYCWKGEKQACRGCNRESYPSKKEKLDGRPPVAGFGGGHDSSRCAMCHKLGYDCSDRVRVASTDRPRVGCSREKKQKAINYVC